MNNTKHIDNSYRSPLATKRVKFDFVYILKFVAIILITNSHFKPVYSGIFCQLAFGGAMGCSLFFFVSGFTLDQSKKDSFLKWYGKRILRIYPAMWIFYLVTFRFDSWVSFLWPHLWFLQAIMVFYALFYFISKYLSAYYATIAALLVIPLLVVYTICDHSEWMIDYAQHPFKIHWIYYFAIMLIGAWYRENMNQSYYLDRWSLIGISGISFILTYGLKLVCEKKIIPMDFQLLFPVLLLLSVFVFQFTAMKFDLQDNTFSKIVIWVANRTLELFIVQILIKDFSVIQYPVIRFVAVIFAILLAASTLHWAVNFIVPPLIKKYF